MSQDKESKTIAGEAAKIIRYADRLKMAGKIADALEMKHNVKSSKQNVDQKINSTYMDLEKAEHEVELARSKAPLDIELILKKKHEMRKLKYEYEDLQEERELLFGKKLVMDEED